MEDIESDDIFFDIGANTGLYTLFVSKLCQSGTVVAFEPYPPNIALLKRDISRNGADNVEVREVALTNTEGTISFNQPEQPDIGYGSASVDPSDSNQTIEVPTTSGDQLVADGEVPQPNVVKIDFEGSEPIVIEGMSDTLSSEECRLVFCEVHLSNVKHRPSIEDFGSTMADLQAQLEACGFTVERNRTRGSEVLLKARK
ncbi:FkbM family methyltransferase [Haloplanus halophilus]|uniref:FkbM family methyltransferase n=1 Tax=Haloplanus halophilus TaxID=2949993 RepID=UPI00203FCF7C|nr:FkbM family methyltransferase [Haloplanus sp. GDY1]